MVSQLVPVQFKNPPLVFGSSIHCSQVLQSIRRHKCIVDSKIRGSDSVPCLPTPLCVTSSVQVLPNNCTACGIWTDRLRMLPWEDTTWIQAPSKLSSSINMRWAIQAQFSHISFLFNHIPTDRVYQLPQLTKINLVVQKHIVWIPYWKGKLRS